MMARICWVGAKISTHYAHQNRIITLGEGAEPMETGQGWYLVAIAGNLKGQEFPVTERRLSVGREDHNDLVLNDDNVSRRHLEIHEQDAKVMVADLGSRNGTFINNQRITGNVFLDEGDRLALGSHLLEVRHRGRRRRKAPAAAPMAPPPGDLGDEEKTEVHLASNMVEWMPGQEGSAKSPPLGNKPKSPSAKRKAKASSPKPKPKGTPHLSPARLAKAAHTGGRDRGRRPGPRGHNPAHQGAPKGKHPGSPPPPSNPSAPQSLLAMDDPPTFISEMPMEEEEEKTMILPDPPPPTKPTTSPPAGFGAGLDLEEATMIHPSVLKGGDMPPPSAFSGELKDPSRGSRQGQGGFQAIGSAQAEMPMNLSPEPPPEAPRAKPQGSRKAIVFGGGAILVVCMVAAAVVGMKEPGAAEAPAQAAPERGLALQERSPARADDIGSLLSGEGGGSLVVGPQAFKLEAAEAQLPAEERRQLAQEVFDQAVSFTNSERLKEALREFNHALALDGSCDICMIRANKVARALKERIEKYNNDGLRYFQALKYEQAYQSWERALLLLDDPSSPAGQRIQAKMVEARQQHAKQSYR